MIEIENELSAKLAELVETIVEVQTLAKEVKAQGGNVQRAFLAQMDEADRAELALQWPIISMFLGV